MSRENLPSVGEKPRADPWLLLRGPDTTTRAVFTTARFPHKPRKNNDLLRVSRPYVRGIGLTPRRSLRKGPMLSVTFSPAQRLMNHPLRERIIKGSASDVAGEFRQDFMGEGEGDLFPARRRTPAVAVNDGPVQSGQHDFVVGADIALARR